MTNLVAVVVAVVKSKVLYNLYDADVERTSDGIRWRVFARNIFNDVVFELFRTRVSRFHVLSRTSTVLSIFVDNKVS